MKDIDFDELDKAVNSLMSSAASNAAPSKSMNTEPASPVTVSISPSSTPEVTSNTVETEEVSTIPVTVQPRESQPVRRTGRFMDMVQKPSDVKPRPVVTSREGLTIAPRPSNEQTITKEAPELEPERNDEQAFDLPTNQVSESIVQVESESGINEDISSESEESDTLGNQNPLESPFLIDTKVEKRPLNAEASHTQEDITNTESYEEHDDLEHDIHGSSDDPMENPEVPELNSDLVAIESQDDTKIEPAAPSSATATQSATPDVPLGAASIPQQYTQKASSGDQSHAAIYDASSYPEPLAHPAKTKSGWLWVLWVILLLGIGAGGAFLLYSLGIIP